MSLLRQLFGLDGRIAVVTGGASGLGASFSTNSPRGTPSTKRIVKNTTLPVAPVSWIATIPGWSSFRAARASVSKRALSRGEVEVSVLSATISRDSTWIAL